MGGFFLFALTVVGLLAAASWLLAVTSLDSVKIWRRLSATEAEVGDVLTARLVIHNRKGRPAPWILWSDRVAPGVDVEGETAGLKTLGSGERLHRSYKIHTVRRGLFRIGPVELESSGPFGMLRRLAVAQDASWITVLPQAVDLARGWPLGHRPVHQVPRRRSLFEDPSRFQGIREYRPGDSLRRVHWRATARSGQLQVKLFEPTVLEGIHLVVDLKSDLYRDLQHGLQEDRVVEAAEDGWVDPLAGVDAVLELAITAAASLARFVLDGDQRVALTSNGADAGSGERLSLAPGKGGEHWHRLRTLLARAIPAPSPSAAELLATELPRLPRALVTIVVTPYVDDGLVEALWMLHRSGIEAGVVRVGPDRPGRRAPTRSLPPATPIWLVRTADELPDLGSRTL